MKKIIICTIMLSCILVVGCNKEAVSKKGQKENKFELFQLIEVYDNHVREYRDKETGVHYFIYAEDIVEGGMGGMCPRYNADGTLYITKDEE